ncbi:TPA: hypothetical protein HA265_07315 [Candidatus Woesearchaeota archaeon]|nr:hypothetical protein [Candidatus Woesearchaeota archaeon]
MEKKEIHIKKVTGTQEYHPVDIWEPVGKADPKYAGRYSGNNSALVFVDENLDQYVGIWTPELVEELEAKGYRHAHFYVPHSNDGGRFLREEFPGVMERLRQREMREEVRENLKDRELGDITDLL